LINLITILIEGKKIVISCERGIEYKEPKRKLKKEDTATRKYECLFRLKGYFLAS
jgi:HSP20 family molecular chaperone IbpA